MEIDKFTTLSEVQKWLRDQTPGSTLAVQNSLFNAQMVNMLFTLLGQADITIDKIDVKVDTNYAEVSGTTTLLGYEGTTISLIFTTSSEAGLQVQAGFDLGPKVTWTLIESFQLRFTQLKGDVVTDPELKVLSLGFSTVILASKSDFQIPVQMQVPTSDQDWTVSGSFKDFGKMTSEALEAIAGDTDITSILPTELVNFDYLQLKAFQVSFNPFAQTCSYIRIDIGYTNPDGWKIFSDKFQLSGIEFDFEVFNPLNGKLQKSYQAKLIGHFKIGSVDFEVGGMFPSDTIFAQLEDGSKLNLTDVFTFFHVPLPKDFPDILISSLAFILYTGDDDKGFEFNIAITDPIKIVDKVSLDNFYFYIEAGYDGDGNFTPSGNLSTQFTIGSTTLFLQGNYDSQKGTTLYGEVDNLPVGDLLNDLAHKFGLEDLPAFISKIVLTRSWVLYSTDGTFKFYCAATTEVAAKKIDIFVNISALRDGEGYKKHFSGAIQVGKQYFEISADSSPKDSVISASWQDTSGVGFGLVDIANAFGDSSLTSLLKDIPSEMDLGLTSLSFTYDITNHELVISATSKNYGNAVFVAVKPKDQWVFAFLVAIDKIDLTRLPLIGEEIGKLGKFEIDDLNLLLCSGVLTLEQVQGINKLIQAAAKKTGTTLPTLPEVAAGLKRGVNLSMTFEVAGFTAPVAVGTATAQGGRSQALITLNEAGEIEEPGTALVLAGVGDGDNLQTQNGYWVNIQKAFGPVYMDKIGFAYSKGELQIAFNFAMNLSALTITLDGLSVGSPLKKFKPSFGLQGLSLTFKSSAVEISGGFIRVERDGITEYFGQALVKAGSFTLSAMGSYAKVNGETSLFVFALLSAPLGGPPIFFVTGVAAGFGYNRGLVLPNIDQVPTFPLTSGFVPGQSSPFSNDDPGKALQVLVSQNIVPIQIGQNWLAAGIQFTSFEMLQSFALVIVEFGASLEIGLLGMTTASIPTGDPRPLLYAQLAIAVSIKPDEGILSVDAKLASTSYLLDPSCQLTGGFAFYLWFGKNTNAGDFVLTLGGYHPNFNKPSHYPDVPRLGFNWVVTSELTIKGGMYFALTPVCLMAGGSLQANWQSGDLKAWFNLGADFLIAWQPYHYSIDVYISFGVSYTFRIDLLFATITKTISVSLGASLSIWGPAFSGVAEIHLWIISFTIGFGASSAQNPPPIAWNEFEQSFFPASKDAAHQQMRLERRLKKLTAGAVPVGLTAQLYQVWTNSVLDGLVKNVEAGADNPDDIDWIINLNGTVLESKTLVPAKKYTPVVQGMQDGKPVKAKPSQIVITNLDELKKINVDFGVGPSDVDPKDFDSEMTITLTYENGLISDEQVFYFTGIIGSAPKAMWHHGAPDISDDKTLIENVLLGFDITTGELEPSFTPWVDIALLAYKDYDYKPLLTWSTPDVVAGPPQPTDPFTQLEQTIQAAPSRSSILDALRAQGTPVMAPADVNVQHMAQEAAKFLLAPPIFAYEYEAPNQKH